MVVASGFFLLLDLWLARAGRGSVQFDSGSHQKSEPFNRVELVLYVDRENRRDVMLSLLPRQTSSQIEKVSE